MPVRFIAAVHRVKVPEAHIGVLLTILGLIGLAAIAAFVAFKWRERRRRRQALTSRMKALQLTEREQNLVRRLARYAWSRSRVAGEPMQVIEEASVFEEAVDGFLHNLMRTRGRVKLGLYDAAINAPPAEAQMIGAVRGKLGYDGPQRGVYYSTRQLPHDQEVYIGIGTGAKASTVRAKIGLPREDFLQLVKIEPRDALIVGHTADIGFFSRNHNFNFVTQIVEIDRAKGACHALHSQTVRTGGRRRYYRVPVGGPVRLGAPEATSDRMFEGLLHDLSARGAGVICPVRLDGIDRLTLDISPHLYFEQTAKTLAPRLSLSQGTVNRLNLSDVRVMASVVNVQQCDDGFFYHLEFRAIQPTEEQHLSRFVNVLERAALK